MSQLKSVAENQEANNPATKLVVKQIAIAMIAKTVGTMVAIYVYNKFTSRFS